MCSLCRGDEQKHNNGPLCLYKRCMACKMACLQVVNYMAVMALLLNQDRCTKNFNIYWDRTGTNEWMFVSPGCLQRSCLHSLLRGTGRTGSLDAEHSKALGPGSPQANFTHASCSCCMNSMYWLA